MAAGPGADLYAAGCILYEMVTGRVPFEGPSLPDLMEQHLTRPPVPPRDLKPGIPVALNDLVLPCCLKKRRVVRPVPRKSWASLPVSGTHGGWRRQL